MREVHTGNLTRLKNGKINWKTNIGKIINFVYDDIESKLEILDYEKNIIKLKYDNDIFFINSANFLKCRLGGILGKRNLKFQFENDSIITNVNSGKLKIINGFRKGKYNTKYYA